MVEQYADLSDIQPSCLPDFLVHGRFIRKDVSKDASTAFVSIFWKFRQIIQSKCWSSGVWNDRTPWRVAVLRLSASSNMGMAIVAGAALFRTGIGVSTDLIKGAK